MDEELNTHFDQQADPADAYKVGGIENGELGHRRDIMESQGLRSPSGTSGVAARADQKDREEKDALALDIALEGLTERTIQQFMTFSAITINITAAAETADRFFADDAFRKTRIADFRRSQPNSALSDQDIAAYYAAMQALRDDPGNADAIQATQDLVDFDPSGIEALDRQDQRSVIQKTSRCLGPPN
ncbi:MAG: hypothetical protein HRU11_15340 [Parvularculaceae bacterium]|nr:hypothetical protein [Parvularculaceae bacterium]